MAASTATKIERILVYLPKVTGSSQLCFEQASFVQSILDSLDCADHELNVYAQLKDGKLLLSRESLAGGYGPVKMKRPSFCPIHNLNPDQICQIPEHIQSRGIDVGAATIIETCDGQFLLTRRAAHLNAFPGVWVPPGGHLEQGETLLEAGLRELKEETGLDIATSDCEKDAIPLLALWESVYPAMLSAGLPRRHHTVLYLYAKLKSPLSSTLLQSLLRPDPCEVGACAWLDRKMVEAIVAATEESRNVEVDISSLPETFRATIVGPNGDLLAADLPSTILTRVATGDTTDIERVSTGSKFALSELLAKTQDLRRK